MVIKNSPEHHKQSFFAQKIANLMPRSNSVTRSPAHKQAYCAPSSLNPVMAKTDFAVFTRLRPSKNRQNLTLVDAGT